MHVFEAKGRPMAGSQGITEIKKCPDAQMPRRQACLALPKKTVGCQSDSARKLQSISNLGTIANTISVW
jgi:hypothetical protein